MALRNQEIAERIKKLRVDRGEPPQAVVAAALPVSERALQNWEAGEVKPSFRNLQKLAAYYGVSEEFILTGAEEAPRTNGAGPSQLDRMESMLQDILTYLQTGGVRETVADIDTRLGRVEDAVDAISDVLPGLSGSQRSESDSTPVPKRRRASR